MPANLSQGNGQYSLLSTAGTYTLNQGQQAGLAANPGVYYGLNITALGTTPLAVVLDIIPPRGTSTATTTNTIAIHTGTAQGQSFNGGIPGVGVRYQGALAIVWTGTAASAVALWD